MVAYADGWKINPGKGGKEHVLRGGLGNGEAKRGKWDCKIENPWAACFPSHNFNLATYASIL